MTLMTQTQILMGKRTELDKFMAYAVKHAHKFVSMEYFSACGRQISHTTKAAYEVGTVNQAALMKSYVKYVFDQRKASQVTV